MLVCVCAMLLCVYDCCLRVGVTVLVLIFVRGVRVRTVSLCVCILVVAVVAGVYVSVRNFVGVGTCVMYVFPSLSSSD